MNKWIPISNSTRISGGLLLVRLIMGAALLLHGLHKMDRVSTWMGPESPVPGFLQALGAVSELTGGLALMLGFLTPLASLGVMVTLAIAWFLHLRKGDPFVGNDSSYELVATYFSVCLMIVAAGPGRYSLDAVIFNQKRSSPSSI